MANRAGELIAQRLPDRAIAEQLGLKGHAGRMAVSRHRRNHIEKPAKAIAAAANKGRDLADRPREVIVAAEAGDPLDYLTVDSIVGDVRRVNERLERTADEAEKGGQRVAVASLSGQQLRAAEVRGKIAGVGGYAASKTQIGIGIGQRAFEPFVLRLHLGEESQTLILAPEDAPPFEVRYEDGRPFDTRDVTTNNLVFVPRGYPTNAPVIEGVAAPIADPAPDERDDGDEDTELMSNADIEKIVEKARASAAPTPEEDAIE
jgi:hypothetical protein